MIGELPTSVTVNGTEYDIRSDFRDILKIVCAFEDPELEPKEKAYICLFIFYVDFGLLPESDYDEAYKAAMRFIDFSSSSEDNRKSPRVMDWEQDENIMFPAVNKVAGFETRSCEYLHWWTFMGYYMEIDEGVFSHVVSIRSKKAKRKKLEKWETEFWNANRDICVLKEKLTAEEQEEKERLNKILS